MKSLSVIDRLVLASGKSEYSIRQISHQLMAEVLKQAVEERNLALAELIVKSVEYSYPGLIGELAD